MNVSIQNVIHHVPLFTSFSPEELEDLTSQFKIANFSEGEIIFNEDDPGTALYIVAEGMIEIIKSMGLPGERLLAERRHPEYFGEMSFFNFEDKRTATARAGSNSILITLTKDDFNNLLSRYPQLAFEMVRVLSLRLNESHNHSIKDLLKINQELFQANSDLLAAQEELIEKKKMEHELQVGQDIQMSILPQFIPNLKKLELGVLMKPARKVGGDFYDVVKLNENQLALVVGDVTDKGIPAAIFMAQSYALIHAAINQHVSPRETLLKVNQSLLEMNANGLFVTVMYGIIDLSKMEFKYARAGHELPVIAHVDGSVEELSYDIGQPLGILDDPLIDEQLVRLAPGSSLLFYTDGLTDNGINPNKSPDGSNNGHSSQQIQKSGWMRLFSEIRHLPAQEICNLIFENFCYPPQFDDVTLMVMKIS